MRLMVIILAALLPSPAVATDLQQDAEPPRIDLAGEVEISRLIDLCAERLDLSIEYDASQVRGSTTLRLGTALTDEELWLLTNQILAARGLASVQLPGKPVVSIVRIGDARGLARIDQLPPPPGSPSQDAEALPPTVHPRIASDSPGAGYVTVVRRIEHRSVQRILDAVEPLMSRTGSVATALGDDGLILLADLKPRIEEVLQLIDQIDVPVDPPVIRKITTEQLDATQLASLVTGAAQARDSLAAKPLRGKITPVPDGTAVIVVAPPDELEQWRILIEQFDDREEVIRRSYTPRHFAVDEVRRLIEDAAQTIGPRGSGDRWRIATDDITGTIIVTATPREHDRIEELIDRLNDLPQDSRRPMRAFSIRNRSAQEIAEVITRLQEAGVLDQSEWREPERMRRTTGIRWQEGRTRPARETNRPGQEPDSDERDARDAEGDQQPRRAAAAEAGLTLTTDEGTNTLIATGSPRTLAQLDDLIRTLDRRQPQVMLEVMVISLTDSDSLDLGVELQKMEVSGSTLINLSSLFGLGTTPAAGLETLPAPGQGFSGSVLSPGDFSVLLRALETINEGRSLSLPKVLVGNNQQATLDSVLQEPFTSLNAFDTAATTTLGGTVDAGTMVTVVPQITEGDHLALDYAVSLSSFVGESPEPGLPPPRQQNQLRSRVTIPDGYTVVVGGLEVSSESEGVTQVPLLGSIPGIGEAFKSRSVSRSRTRFFVFIRPTILRHDGFRDLQYLSDEDARQTGIAEIARDWPTVKPRIVR